MIVGSQALARLRRDTKEKDSGSVHWLDVSEKYDLYKITRDDLIAEGFDAVVADKIVGALFEHGDLAPLGKALGIHLRDKFKVWAEIDRAVCKIRTAGAENAEWLRSYLSGKLPEFDVQKASAEELIVRANGSASPWLLQKALRECPAAKLMRLFPVRIADRPHYVIQARDLAAWVEAQGEGTWWRVDGDHVLMIMLTFPCPPEELAGKLRAIGKPLLVADPNEVGAGEEVDSKGLSRLVDAREFDAPSLHLAWAGGPSDWFLIEDEPPGEF